MPPLMRIESILGHGEAGPFPDSEVKKWMLSPSNLHYFLATPGPAHNTACSSA